MSYDYTGSDLGFYYWGNNSDIAWGEVTHKKIQQNEDIRFKNYYRNYIDCHKIFIIAYPKRIFFNQAPMKQRIEFKGSYSRKHQRPRKLRGQRIF